jgi:hypothetical protein
MNVSSLSCKLRVEIRLSQNFKLQSFELTRVFCIFLTEA